MNIATRFVMTLVLFSFPSWAAAAPVPAATPPPSSAPCVQSSAAASAAAITYFQDCEDSPEMTPIAGGTFRMGDALGSGKQYEQPVHEVTISAFAIGRYEVTRAEWQACIAAGACTQPQKPADVTQGRNPVAAVSWVQVKRYVGWLTQHTGKPYRLPSEAEWEYAARAGSVGNFTWYLGQIDKTACAYANVLDRSGYARHSQMSWFADCDDGYAETAPVGSFPANAWGVSDMQGNVWEWVEDCWHPDYVGAPSDGSAWTNSGNCLKRVNRGGGWGNGPPALRLPNRDADPADASSDGLGFRVALTIDAAKP